MKALMLIVAICVLTACAGVHQLEQVYVPVHTPCVDQVPERPASEFDKAMATEYPTIEIELFEKLKALLIDRENDKLYQAELKAVIEGCT